MLKGTGKESCLLELQNIRKEKGSIVHGKVYENSYKKNNILRISPSQSSIRKNFTRNGLILA